MKRLGCDCPGSAFFAGMSGPEPHWEMWSQDLIGGPEPLATQEDGLCDGCRANCEDLGRGWRESLEALRAR